MFSKYSDNTFGKGKYIYIGKKKHKRKSKTLIVQGSHKEYKLTKEESDAINERLNKAKRGKSY